jgi:voltage-gated potassium channel
LTIDIVDASLIEKYVNSLYWALTTMATVGYGDIRGASTPERLCNILAMLIGAGLYA